MKILVKPSLSQINEYKNIDGFILPLKEYSTDYESYFTIDEIINIKTKSNKEIFVVLNRMFFNEDIDSLKQILKKIDELNLTGIFFYDLSILQLKKELNLKTDLVWNATHMVTNYKTCNYYLEKGVKYAYLSNEITFNEIIEIKEKSNIIPLFTLIGYPTVANSNRYLITNYNKMHNLKNNSKLIIEEKITKDKYILSENKFGTTFKYGKVLNNSTILHTLKEINFPYIVLIEDFIDHNDFLKILDIINNKEDYTEIAKLVGNNTGFLNKETIYKVKKNG